VPRQDEDARKGKYYSCNEANLSLFPEHYRTYLYDLRCREAGEEYSSRYIGSLVADFHRTLLKGWGVSVPPTARYPHGKLRLLYEAKPLALIAEQAGGMAINDEEPILGLQPRGIHQRTPFVAGGGVPRSRVPQTRWRLAISRLAGEVARETSSSHFTSVGRSPPGLRAGPASIKSISSPR
jgi:hypothetical protein